jgi:glycine cleavage system H protein
MYYTDTHEWVAIDGAQGTVGITQYAQQELGAIVYVQLPQIGQIIKMGEEICTLESTKAAADVYAPLSGVVSAVNEELSQSPDRINQSPETTGWLFRITLSAPSEVKTLLTLSEYRAILES